MNLILSAMSSVSSRKGLSRIPRFAVRVLLFFVFTLSVDPALIIAQDKSVPPEFQFDILSFQTKSFSPDSARVDIYVAVPYSWLLFLNADDKYVADYEVEVSVIDPRSDSVIRKRSQPLTVILNTSEWEKLHELDLTRADASQSSFVLKQGWMYRARIEIRDLSTHKSQSDSRTFDVRTFTPGVTSMSDILLYKSKEGTHIIPHIGSDISSLRIDEAGIFGEVYNASQSVPLWLLTRVRMADDGEEIAREVNVEVPTGVKRMPVFIPFVQEDLWSGKYVIESYILSEAKDTLLSSASELLRRSVAHSSRSIEVTGVHGVPLANLDLDDAIQQLTYIAFGGAYDSLFYAQTKQEKRKAIMEFWEKMNWYHEQRTTRPMEVFYRRVQYANDHFKSVSQGWRSDRGKVYIMLGSPTSIDRHTYDAVSKPYEVWHYYDLNLTYYFSDQFMLGDYRLMSTSPVVGTFLWQRESY